ncbi:MAG: lysophospholipid acyltransferase family protein [Syntrophobacteraceae bacterium]
MLERSGRGPGALKMGKKGKGKTFQIVEYLAFYTTVAIARSLSLGVLRVICGFLGYLLYAAIPRRRKIALQNIKIAFGDKMSEKEIRELARLSCKAFLLTAVEMIKSPFRLEGARIIRDRHYKTEHLEHLFQKAKMIHDEAGGCIFVTPHLGNWELMPYVSALIGIPLAIVIRPLDNPYLERAIFSSRITSGHFMIPKKNAMFLLERMLRKGKSVGMLPDQKTSRGLRVKFFGENATVTPIPAMLAIRYGRPVVVVAACRTNDPYFFEGFVSDPIWPDPHSADERSEMVRITGEINLKMEEIIRRYPEQYLWMHNRWKASDRKPIFVNKNSDPGP